MEELFEKVKWSSIKNILELAIPELLRDTDKKIDLNELECSPSDILDILEELGWEYEMLGENGWEQDTDYLLTHPMYKKGLLLSYSGFYWTGWLHADCYH